MEQRLQEEASPIVEGARVCVRVCVCMRTHVHVGTRAARPNYIFISRSDIEHNGPHYNCLPLLKS